MTDHNLGRRDSAGITRRASTPATVVVYGAAAVAVLLTAAAVLYLGALCVPAAAARPGHVPGAPIAAAATWRAW